MMDDVLISNLPPELLRSALRVLVSQGSTTQRPFVQHIREQLLDSPPDFPPWQELFPSSDTASPEFKRHLALIRCLFSSKLSQEALPYFVHYLDCLRISQTRWADGSGLEATLTSFGGDIVQAIQALKESNPEPTRDLAASLETLLSALKAFRIYCDTALRGPLTYPFSRSEAQVRDVVQFLYPGKLPAPSPDDKEAATISVNLPQEPQLETIQVGPYRFPRLLNGLWQLASPSWGSGTAEKQQAALVQLVESGFVAADMADHYGDAELVYGNFRNSLPREVRDQVYAATKWCIFSPVQKPITTEWVLQQVKERCRRLGGRVELLQFHWYDYEAKEYLDILVELVGITMTHPELMSTIGLCNFDSQHTSEACEYLLSKTGAVGIVSNQVQFSLLDSRPLQEMCGVCDKYGLKLLTYGSFCGGFLSEKWLNKPTPKIYSEPSGLTPSQRKYFDMIKTWGSWAELQALLAALSAVARKHDVSLTNVATRWVLQQPAVGAVIVGTRLGVSAHGDENARVFDFELDGDDLAAINAVALGEDRSKASAVYETLGDCGNEYRAMH